MKRKVDRQGRKGQSMVEFALVLPFLVLLFLGMIEVGYAMYDYIVLSNANREGVRLAARGRFTDETIIERIIAGGGFQEEAGSMVPILSTDENFGVIITHIPLPKDAKANWQTDVVIFPCCQPDCPDKVVGRINITVCAEHGVVMENGELRDITGADSRLADLDEYNDNVDISAVINQLREDGGLIEMGNEVVVIETFFTHPTLLHLPNTIPLYFRSSMRVSQ